MVQTLNILKVKNKGFEESKVKKHAEFLHIDIFGIPLGVPLADYAHSY